MESENDEEYSADADAKDASDTEYSMDDEVKDDAPEPTKKVAMMHNLQQESEDDEYSEDRNDYESEDHIELGG